MLIKINAFGRSLLGLAAIVLLAYSGLWLMSRQMQAAYFEEARVEPFREHIEESIESRDDGTGDFAVGTSALLAARQDWLGLFPYYDPETVSWGVRQLVKASQSTRDPSSHAETAFFVAKAYLMKGEAVTARRWLEEALAQNVETLRDESLALLAKLQQSR